MTGHPIIGRTHYFLDKFKSGFHQNDNTESTLLKVIDNIFMCADKCENAAVLVPYLFAAFDTIDHIFLIESVKLIWNFLLCF